MTPDYSKGYRAGRRRALADQRAEFIAAMMVRLVPALMAPGSTWGTVKLGKHQQFTGEERVAFAHRLAVKAWEAL